TVFLCLSPDMIVTQLTRALLQGMRIDFGSTPDGMVLKTAFHDLIALLQRLLPSGVLRHEIAVARGRLEDLQSLGAIQVQIGAALGGPDGLRNALGFSDANGRWHARVRDPKAYSTEEEPHARGDIMISAVFEALKKIYESRVSDLRRIASKG